MMTMSEESRHRLYSRLEDLLGPVEATTLMEHLPAGASSDLVTRRDFEAFAVQLRTELRADFAEFRAEFEQFRGEMRTEFAEFRGEVRAEIRSQVRTLLLSLVALQISAASLVVAVIHLV